MKKIRRDDDEMRPEYDFSGGVRGKYAARYAKGTNVITNEHRQAEAYAAEAALLSRRGDVGEAAELYRQAASAERQALALVPRDQVRTWSAFAVSLASLLYKGQAFSEAERTILSLLESEALLPWARGELSELLEAVTEKTMAHR